MTDEEAREMMQMMDDAMQGMVPPALKEKGWVYRDLPGRFTFEMWDLLLSIFGEGNYQILAMTINEKEDWKRGQFFLSPEAMENLVNYSKRKAS